MRKTCLQSATRCRLSLKIGRGNGGCRQWSRWFSQLRRPESQLSAGSWHIKKSTCRLLGFIIGYRRVGSPTAKGSTHVVFEFILEVSNVSWLTGKLGTIYGTTPCDFHWNWGRPLAGVPTCHGRMAETLKCPSKMKIVWCCWLPMNIPRIS